VAVEAPYDGGVLTEVLTTVGNPPRQTDTSPSFGVQVIAINEQ
jgi:hypothetical protein